MKKYKNPITPQLTVVLCIALLLMVGALGCKKSSPTPVDTTAPIPTVTGFTPTVAKSGDTLTITGTNLDPNLLTTVVTIGRERAQLISASPVNIRAIVPVNAGSGNVTVVVDRHSYTAPQPFSFMPAYTVSKLTGTAATATYGQPASLLVDPTDAIYVAEKSANKITRINPDGTMVLVAGGVAGSNAGVGNFVYGVTGAKFMGPAGLAFFSFSAAISNISVLWVVDQGNNTILAYSSSPAFPSPYNGFGPNGPAYQDGTSNGQNAGAPVLRPNPAQFNGPGGIDFDTKGNLVIADQLNHRIRYYTPLQNAVTTLAGGTTVTKAPFPAPMPGFVDGPGAQARFNNPVDVAVDDYNNVYVVDQGNHAIRKIDASGTVSTLAGGGPSQPGYQDGPGLQARFNQPAALALDVAGNVYVADMGNNCIRRIDSNGSVTTIAGTTTPGYTEGPGDMARFTQPAAIALDVQGTIYVGDATTVRKITIQ